MLKDLRCDNDERVWETAFAVAYVQSFRQLQPSRGLAAPMTAAMEADKLADLAVGSLRALRSASRCTDG